MFSMIWVGYPFLHHLEPRRKSRHRPQCNSRHPPKLARQRRLPQQTTWTIYSEFSVGADRVIVVHLVEQMFGAIYLNGTAHNHSPRVNPQKRIFWGYSSRGSCYWRLISEMILVCYKSKLHIPSLLSLRRLFSLKSIPFFRSIRLLRKGMKSSNFIFECRIH